MIEVSLITVNFNGLDDTCEMIESFVRLHTSIAYEIIVVDNASVIDEAAIIQSRFPHVTTIRSEINLGFAGGNNLAVSAAKGRFLFFINNDTYVCHSPFEAMIDRLESDPQIGMVCPKIRFSEEPNLIQFAGYTALSAFTLRNELIGFGCPDSEQFDRSIDTPYAHGAAMMIRRITLEEVGLMREDYFLYYEELDWSIRIAKSGKRIVYEPQSTIFHKESRSTGQDSPLKTYYLTRNRLWFAQFNFSIGRRILIHLYLICLTVPIHYIKYRLKGRSDNARSILSAVKDFFLNKTGNTYVRNI